MRFRRHFRGDAALRDEREREMDEAYLKLCTEQREAVDLSCRASNFFEEQLAHPQCPG